MWKLTLTRRDVKREGGRVKQKRKKGCKINSENSMESKERREGSQIRNEGGSISLGEGERSATFGKAKKEGK